MRSLKKGLVIIYIFVFFILSSCNNVPIEKSSTSSFISIEVNDIERILNDNSNMIIYYGQEYCGACIAMKANLDEIMIALDLSVYYLNADLVEDDAFLKKHNIVSTPSLIFINSDNSIVYDTDIPFEILSNICETYKKSKVLPERLKGILTVTYDELLIKLAGQIDFLLYIGRPDCPDCERFSPIIENHIAEHDYSGVYYLNIKAFRDAANSENATKEEIEFYDSLKNTFNIEWVPSVYHIQKGEILSKFEYLSTDYYALENDGEKSQMENKYKSDFITWIKKELNY